jgi:hypothetical protein
MHSRRPSSQLECSRRGLPHFLDSIQDATFHKNPCQELSFMPLVNKLPLTLVCAFVGWIFRHLILFYSSNPIAAVQSWLVPTLTLYVGISNFSGPTFSLQFTLNCRILCERVYPQIIFDKSHYVAGKKYCRMCDVYHCYNGAFGPCCGMAL